ncbi:MAG: MBL fold metallo-hydrolase [Lentisphaerae bacterium]|jgi:cyclase|nr:MBL fold metallo-hydrolase [Lentisphaerota bacterium]MBT4823165.1 MBL fold metallo-hydrolase [Lentisphaerota bacterium]MBT5610447.1 MBL fold metallo-hydrolase [Lentisphaerota bacterium]MBT7061038.1 MBL fold metallo-hydrolase [Lentisphaerota bacterium]MBT7842177.1 MBL fold metallo-hydrolase [Lentisphaerota bacterium]
MKLPLSDPMSPFSLPENPDAPKLLHPTPAVTVRQEIDNMGWVDMGDHVLIVDALEQAENEASVLAAIHETTQAKPVRTVLNTHTHYDHIVLNPVFEERFGATIVNARTTAVPAEGLWFEGQDRRALFLPMPDCHTSEDCVVWCPEDRVLFTGDIFGWGLIPWEKGLNRAKAECLKASYERLIAFEADCVVPGHGPVCSSAELRRWVVYFDELIGSVRRLCTNGLAPAAILAELPPPDDMSEWWRFRQWKHQDTLEKVIAAVTAGDL